MRRPLSKSRVLVSWPAGARKLEPAGPRLTPGTRTIAGQLQPEGQSVGADSTTRRGGNKAEVRKEEHQDALLTYTETLTVCSLFGVCFGTVDKFMLYKQGT